MVLYRYESLSEQGKAQTGWINADTLEEAKQELLGKKVLLMKIRGLKSNECPNLKKQDLLSLTGELSKLLRAGLPLYESLLALEEKYQQHKSHLIILSLCDHIKSGRSLSEAMRQYPSSFDTLYCSMVANAEKSGTLLDALEEISGLLSKQQKLKKQITNALLYPGILTVFCCIVITSLLYFVIPSLFELFEGRELHPFTAFVISVSQLAIRFKTVVFLLVVSFFALIFAGAFYKPVRRFLYGKCMGLWGIKKLLMKIALIRFSRSCGTMLQEGIPLLQALQMSKEAVNHPPLEKILSKVERKVMEGGSIIDEFQKHSDIPRLFIRMLGIAEKSGKTSSMLLQMTQIYEEELEKTFQQVTTIAQPVILLVLGFIVGLVLLSVLLPLTDVSSFISA